jgi:hypothetical protein
VSRRRSPRPALRPMGWRMGWRLGALLLPLASGCAAPEAHVPPDVLQRLQAEARNEIYDRENDVAIAKNKLDEVQARAQAVQRQLASLDEVGKRARARLARAGAADRAGKLDQPLAARRAYLDAQLRQLAALREVAVAQIAAARGRMEQTRQRELVRTGHALARSMVPFDDNVMALDQRVSERERRDADLKQDTEKAYQAWQAAGSEYAKSTGDYDSAIWTD